MSHQDSGAWWFVSNSLKFRVGSVFVNGKMTISLPTQYSAALGAYIIRLHKEVGF